jgi:predicted dehydrogenase
VAKMLNVGIVGLNMGRSHLKQYVACNRANVVGVCDLNETVLAATAKEFNVPFATTDFQALLQRDDLTAVSIATPNHLHAPMTVAALKAGKHVLCEKPPALNRKQAEAMYAAAAEAKRVLLINFSYRFRAETRWLRQMADAGQLGEVYFGRTVWHRRRGAPRRPSFTTKAVSGGGPLIDLGVHRLDLALWVMGYPEPASISGATYQTFVDEYRQAGQNFDVEDLAVGMVRFTNGTTLFVEASFDGNGPKGEYMETQLYGTKGGAFHQNVGESYDFEAYMMLRQPHGFARVTPCELKMPGTNGPAHLVECILDGAAPLVKPEESIRLAAILDGLYKSAASGRPVALKG